MLMLMWMLKPQSRGQIRVGEVQAWPDIECRDLQL